MLRTVERIRDARRASTTPASAAIGRGCLSTTSWPTGIVDEIKVLGSELGLAIDGQVGAGRKPESVILHTVETGKFDLLIMGVLYRSVDQRLYFGPKGDRILRESNCSVAIVVSPAKTPSGETL